MGSFWKVVQIGTRALAGAAGFALAGPAGAAFGASTVGPMIADGLFPGPADKLYDKHNWVEPDSFSAYQNKPDNRVGVTDSRRIQDAGFKGAMGTVDAVGSAVAPYLGTKGGFFGTGGKGEDWLKKVTGNGPAEEQGLFTPKSPNNGSTLTGLPSLSNVFGNILKKQQPVSTVPNFTKSEGVSEISLTDEEVNNPDLYLKQQRSPKLYAYNSTELQK